jgi:hypothetical protein
MTQLAMGMMCVPAIWFSTSCDAKNQNATTHTFERPMKSSTPRVIPHEVLVKFKDGISKERIAFILRDTKMDIIAEIQQGRLFHVRILDDRSVESAINQLSLYQEVEYAEPNYRYETQK